MPSHLNDPALETQSITLQSQYPPDPAKVPAFVARPREGGPLPGIVLVQEIFGVNDHIKDLACRFALGGFVVVAPELYVREGECPPMSAGREKVMAFLGQIKDEQVLADISAARSYLIGRTTGKIGVVGYCWGGRIAMLAAATELDLQACVAYYGRISGPSSPNQPGQPLDLAPKMRVPLLGHFGAQDPGIPAADAVRLGEALKASNKVAQIHIYENAGHAFSNDTRPDMYRADAAKLAFERSVAWFKAHSSV